MKIIGSLLALTIVGIAVLQLPMFSEVLDRMSSMVDAFLVQVVIRLPLFVWPWLILDGIYFINRL